MFTGIVEEAGSVVESIIEGQTAKITISAPEVHKGVQIGDSISISGCCLTVVAQSGDQLSFEAVPETMQRTKLGSFITGDRVNLERSLAVGARLGGHFVQGHVDGLGTVLSLRSEENGLVIEIGIPDVLLKYVIAKGSVCVDGVSLTVAELREHSFTVWTIPHTREVTTLGSLKVGDKINFECDLLGKYVERLLNFNANSEAILRKTTI